MASFFQCIVLFAFLSVVLTDEGNSKDERISKTKARNADLKLNWEGSEIEREEPLGYLYIHYEATKYPATRNENKGANTAARNVSKSDSGMSVSSPTLKGEFRDHMKSNKSKHGNVGVMELDIINGKEGKTMMSGTVKGEEEKIPKLSDIDSGSSSDIIPSQDEDRDGKEKNFYNDWMKKIERWAKMEERGSLKKAEEEEFRKRIEEMRKEEKRKEQKLMAEGALGRLRVDRNGQGRGGERTEERGKYGIERVKQGEDRIHNEGIEHEEMKAKEEHESRDRKLGRIEGMTASVKEGERWIKEEEKKKADNYRVSRVRGEKERIVERMKNIFGGERRINEEKEGQHRIYRVKGGDVEELEVFRKLNKGERRVQNAAQEKEEYTRHRIDRIKEGKERIYKALRGNEMRKKEENN